MTLPLQRNEKFNFENLFIFEMANNHQGDVEHGKRIIREFAALAREFNIRAAIKLQFRDLDTFIHPAHVNDSTNKHIPRFLGTRLSKEQFRELVNTIREEGLISMATPFDERSVDLIEEFNLPIIKVGSCSAMDRPLLLRVAASGRPVIISTGGLTFDNMDWIAHFMEKRAVHFAFMHCVGEYPTPHTKAHLNQIELMRRAYRGTTIGFSTHESPAETSLIGLAYAKGARIFEKHIGSPTEKYKLNAYSATQEQARLWLNAWKIAVDACGGEHERIVSEKERLDLQSLKRGAYVASDIKKGTKLTEKDVFFAIPIRENQLASDRFLPGLVADKDYFVGDMVGDAIRPQMPTDRELLFSYVRRIRRILNDAKLFVGHDIRVELSMHHGLRKFSEYGCMLVECIMHKEYSKKTIIQMAGQWNPTHYHKKKHETFDVLHGTLIAEVDGKVYHIPPGGKLNVPRGVAHAFGTETGVIFEEISSPEHPGDSFYIDPKVAGKARSERKIVLDYWGQYQYDDHALEV